MSETERELRQGAASHGWTLGREIEVFELVPPESLLDADQQQSLLYSSDLELGETTKLIFDAVERRKPARIVLDSLSEIRLLAQSSLRYRRQILALKHYFARNGATVLMLDDLTTDTNDKTVHSVAHGVIRLEELAPDYGPSGGACGSSNTVGRPSAAAITTSRSRPAGSKSFPGWSRPSTRPASPRRCSAAASRNWTCCSAAASSAGRAR